MHNNDIIHLTDKGRMVVEAMEAGEPGSGTSGDDILAYLEQAEDKAGVVEEIGMNVKVMEEELKEELHKLETGGYIVVEHHDLKRRFTEGPLKGMRIPEEFHHKPGSYPHAAGGGYEVEEEKHLNVEVEPAEPCEEED